MCIRQLKIEKFIRLERDDAAGNINYNNKLFNQTWSQLGYRGMLRENFNFQDVKIN